LGVNVVLQHIDEAVGPDADKYRIKGEAYALRAYYHFMLVNFYAAPYNDSTTTPEKSAGIPLRTNGDLSDDYLTRNTVKEVYTKIENDLDSAIQLLSYNKTIATKTRMNYLAAHLLASRVYLYEEKWDKVIMHTEAVLENQSQLMDLNTWGGFPDMDNKPVVGPGNVEAIFSYGSPAEKTVSGYSIAYDLSHDLVNTFEDGDLRALTGFYVNPPALKFLIAPDFSQQKFQLNNSSTYVNAPSWRTSEAYLNRAEAYLQLYKTTGDAAAATEALNNLNTLRSYRFDPGQFAPWTMQPASSLLQLCREERRRELYCEEMHRWFDLRRYGMPSIKHIYRPAESVVEVYTLKAHDKQYVMPLPADVLQRNPQLIQSPQMSGTRIPD
jgi:hypothetical protein